MASSTSKHLLTVKTANGSAPDLPIDCSTVHCIRDVKTYLSDVHPSHPPVKEQKLIYKGALLHDEKLLKDIFQMDKEVCIHLVISPVVLRSNSVPTASHLKQQQRVDIPHPSPTSATAPSSSSSGPVPSNLSSSSPPTSTQPPPMSEANISTGPRLRHNFRMPMTIPTQQPVAATHPLPVNQMMWGNPYMISPYHAAQLAQWYHHATILQQQATPGWANAENRNQPLLDNQLLLGNGQHPPPAAGGGDPQNQDDLELPDEMGAGGAAGGGFAVMADNNRRRDAVDYAYMLMMLVFLGCIGYITGSFYQFIIFFTGVAIILMNQGGWFRLQRRQVRDPQPDPHPPPQEANPEQEPQPVVNEEIRDEGRINETDNVNQEEPLEHNEEDDGGPHSDPEPTATPSPQPAQPRPGLIATIIVFITSFFSSLLPQQIPELQAN